MPEAEARSYAAEIGAVFKLTSASASTGIEELFKSIGRKFLDPNFKDEEEINAANEMNAIHNESIKLDSTNTKENPKKKKCC